VATRAAGRITEKQFTGQVVQLARMLGWRVYHPWLSIHSAAGFPDLTMVRPPRLVFAELKGGKNTLSPHQERWRDALLAAGCEWYLWTDATDMQAIGEVLAA
jgi:hypothetical protein